MTKQTIANVNGMIDSYQSTQADLVNKYVKNESLAENLHTFINAQTTYAKQAVKTATEFADLSSAYVAKFDIAKAFGVK